MSVVERPPFIDTPIPPKPRWEPQEVLELATYLDAGQQLQPPIEEIEVQVLTDLVNRKSRDSNALEPINPPEEELRFGIVNAKGRKLAGLEYDERHLALNSIFQKLYDIQSILIDNSDKPRL
jgi:hypothetical protein